MSRAAMVTVPPVPPSALILPDWVMLVAVTLVWPPRLMTGAVFVLSVIVDVVLDVVVGAAGVGAETSMLPLAVT